MGQRPTRSNRFWHRDGGAHAIWETDWFHRSDQRPLV